MSKHVDVPTDRPSSGNEIAIIGMAGRFPAARDIDEFWRNLRDGVEGTTEITAADLRAAGIDPAVLDDPDYVRHVFALEDADHFDAGLFGFSPREAEMLDPQQRLLLETAWAALEHAGYDFERYPGLIGVFAGVGRNSHFMHALSARPELLESVGEYSSLIGNERDFPTTHISYRMNLRGPSVDVQSACSTSGVATHLACQSLRAGDSDIALAGGCKVIVPNRAGYLYVEGGPLAPEGHIRAFDADARGMVRGSGAAMLVLKRLEDALADGDSVYGVILGSAVNNDGNAKIGFTAPSVSGQAAVIADALDAAGVSADTISYVETHGTGTILGDPIEVAGLTDAFRQFTDRTGFCSIGSVKTNIGHLDAGATAAGIVKTLLAFQHEQIPPSLNFKRPNPQIDFEHSPFTVCSRLTSWPRGSVPRRAGVSSFGLGGTNAHIVLEESPVLPPSGKSRPYQLLPLSAQSEKALDDATDRLAAHLSESPDVPLADAAFTLQVGRREMTHRRILVSNDVQDATTALRARDPRRVLSSVPRSTSPAMTWLLPGIGTQYPGMAAGLYASEPVFREAIEECAALPSSGGLSAIERMLQLPNGAAPDPELDRPSVSLPPLFAVTYALSRLWGAWGFSPEALVGHSMGEYAAAYLAGVFSLEDAMRLVVCRARIFERLPASGMLSIPLSEAELKELLDERLSIAAVNRPQLCVASGPIAAIDELAERLGERGVEFRRVRIAVGAHSALIDPFLEEFGEVVAGIRLSSPEIPFTSSVTGTWITAAEATDPTYWVRHFRDTVRFSDCLETALTGRTNTLLEVGPGQTLSSIARMHPARDPASSVFSSTRHPQENVDDNLYITQTLGRLWLGGHAVDWDAVHAGQSRRRVALPSYPFQRQRYSLVSDKELERMLDQQTAAKPAAIVQSGPAVTPASAAEAPASAPHSIAAAAPTASRRNRITAELRKIVQGLSGMDLGQVDENATFIELGFDSLFLAEANSAFKKRFQVKLTTRHLMETTPTLAALGAHLDTQLPPDAFPEPAPAPSQSVADATPAITPAAASVAAWPVMPAAGSGNALQELIAQQMQLMQAQLMALSGVANQQGMPAAPAAPSVAVISPASPAPGHNLATQPAAPGVTDKESPWQPVAKGVAESGLNERQQAHLDALVERVTSLTRLSKEQTQLNRSVLSDPRTVQGFRKQWKEIVYPIVSDRAEGSRIWDIDGNEYIDLVNGYGVTFFGHRPKFILDAAREQLDRTIAIGPQTPLAGEVAKLMCEMTGAERAAFCNTGSEAVLAAIRMARTVTGRTKLVTFAGHYHGIFDEVLVKGVGNGAERRTLPQAPGIPAHAVGEVIVLEYDNPASLDAIRKHASELALVMVEPVRSRNLDRQAKEFLRELRRVTEELDIPLLLDEMITGFRSHPGGAQALFGVQADIATYGKIIGGGFPIGVVAGKSRFLDALDGGMWSYGDDSTPDADMTWFAGTFVRHPLALAAAKAALTRLKEGGPELQEGLNRRTREFVEDLNTHFKATNAPIHVEQFASIFFVKFTSFQEYSALLFVHLRNRGIYTYEGRPAFFTLAHSDADIASVASAFKDSVAELQNVGLFSGGPVRRPGETYQIPLSEGQEEIWLATQFGEDASRAFNLGVTLRLKGDLDLDALKAALRQVIGRHESLRAIPDSDGKTQRIMPSVDVELELFDLSAVPADDRDRELLRVRDAEVQTPFDLVNGPLVRSRLIKLAPDDHIFIFAVHHIVCDGWSCGVVMRDLGAFYEAALEQRTPGLRPTMQLSEFVDYSEENRSSEGRVEAEQYWLGQFAESIPVLELPTDRPRPPVKTFRARRITLPLDLDFVGRVKQLAVSQGATTFATLLSGFAAFLNRLSGQEDVVVGFSLAGQSAIPDRDLVGHCVKFLPLHLYPRSDSPFKEFLSTVRGNVLDAVEYQNLAFGGLIQKLKVRRDPSRVPLMSVAFNLDPSGRPPRFGNLAVEASSVPRQFENFDIFFNVVELGGDRLEIQCTFNLDLFDEATMWRFLKQYVVLLDGAVADPAGRIGELPVLTADDLQMASGPLPGGDTLAVMDQLNGTSDASVPTNGAGAALPASASHATAGMETIHAAIEAHALGSPAHLAVRDTTRELSYHALNERAEVLARKVIGAGVQPGHRVGIYLDRSVNLVVAVLGILKAGAAYVPLDPEFPAERLKMMVEDADVRVVLTERMLLHDAPGSNHILMDEIDTTATESATDALPSVSADDLAYVIYTSGSTGRPKGVQVTHGSVVNLLRSMAVEPGIEPGDIWLAVTTLSFDISVLELFGPLLAGATTVVASREEVLDGEMLTRALERSAATIMQATPVAWRMLIESGWEGNPRLKALCGGEALPPDLAADLVRRTRSLWNMYGPTETTIWSTCYRVPDSGGPVLIGRPVANTRVYILDATLRQLPPGVPGEIWIGGDGVARGYHNRADLTQERFVADPFSGIEGSRMYRTGDHGRFLNDGNLEYRNRIDNQVKIRGFRVELGDIESSIVATGLVRQAAVIVRRGGAGDDRLVAFLVADRAATVEAMRAALRERLPEYMIPQHYIPLAGLPTTPNGKIDRIALAQQAVELPGSEAEYVEPRTPREQLVAGVIRDVLGIDQVGADANFFDLGGHSVLAMRVIARLRESGSAQLTLRDLFVQPTVAGLAERIGELDGPSPAARDETREVVVF